MHVLSLVPCRRLLAAALALIACSPAAARAQAEPPALAIVGVIVVPMTEGGGVLRGQTVLVRGGRIEAIGPADRMAVPADAVRVDGAGRWLMPGLADMHVHLEYTPEPDLLPLFVANGVTTIRSMDGRPSILQWRRRIAAGELAGPRIYTAGPLLDGDPPLRDDNTVVRTADEARAAVDAQHAAGYDFIKVYTNLSPDAYQAVLDAARERGMRVAGHVPRRLDLADALASGQHSLEHLADFADAIESADSRVRGRWHWSKLYLGMPADADSARAVAERVAASGVWIVPTVIQADRGLAPMDSMRTWLESPAMHALPMAQAAWDPARWDAEQRQRYEQMDAEDWRAVARGPANRRMLVRALHQAGARLALGTDTPNPFVLPGFSVHDELANFVAAGLPAEAALAAGTREAARMMGDEAEWGTVEVGRRADLLLLDANPLDDVRNASRIAGVVLAGRWLPREALQAMLTPPAT